MKTEIIKSSAIVSLISGIRMCLGVISQMVIAYYFGTSRELDIFFITYAFPSMVSGIALALFGSSIIPELTPIKDLPENLEKAVSSILLYAFVMSLSIGLGGILFSKTILGLTTNLSGNDIAAAQRLSRLIWLVVGLETLNSFLISLYHLQKRFVMPSVFLLLPVIGMIGGTTALSGQMGVAGLVIGWLFMNLLSCLILSRVLFNQYRFSLKKISLSDGHAYAFLRSIFPISITTIPFTILPSIDAYWLSRLAEGSMSYIGYSTRIVLAMGWLVINGIYTVMLPYLSENVRDNEAKMFMSNLTLSIKGVLFIMVPMAFFCLVYREPILELFLQRGKFDSLSLKGVATVLPFYLPGMLAMCPSTLINRAYLARKLFKRLSVLSAILIVFYFVSAGVLSQRFSYIGIGMTYATYWFCFFLSTALFLNRAIINSDLLVFGAKIAGNSFVSVAASYWLFSGIRLPSFAVVIMSFLVTVIIFYFMNKYVLRTKEISRLIETINSKRRTSVLWGRKKSLDKVNMDS